MKPEHRDVAGHRLPGWSVAVLLAFWPSGCERSKPRATPTPLPTPAANALIQFPEALRTEDESVNAFIAEAIRVCASEDYDAFRLLWSALEEPIGKQQFQAGFRATRRVTILDLAKRRLPDGELVYLVYCLVELDPREVPEPTRDIVLLLRKEQGRLAHRHPTAERSPRPQGPLRAAARGGERDIQRAAAGRYRW
jgi:hypothetical protein